RDGRRLDQRSAAHLDADDQLLRQHMARRASRPAHRSVHVHARYRRNRRLEGPNERMPMRKRIELMIKKPQKCEIFAALALACVACGGGTKTITNTVTETFPIYLVAPDGLAYAPIHEHCQKESRHFCVENHASIDLHLAKLELVEKTLPKSFFFG